jgi:hypothetical protein
MSDQIPAPAPDEPAGDIGDQAARLQMQEEQEAIQAALRGEVRGDDSLGDRSATGVDPLEGPDLVDPEALDASDDPVYGGGQPLGEPEEGLDHEARALVDAQTDPAGLDLDDVGGFAAVEVPADAVATEDVP